MYPTRVAPHLRRVRHWSTGASLHTSHSRFFNAKPLSVLPSAAPDATTYPSRIDVRRVPCQWPGRRSVLRGSLARDSTRGSLSRLSSASVHVRRLCPDPTKLSLYFFLHACDHVRLMHADLGQFKLTHTAAGCLKAAADI
jgi:hypothetical protein